jgi:hypothetical protein
MVEREGGAVLAWQFLMKKGHLTEMVLRMASFHCSQLPGRAGGWRQLECFLRHSAAIE